MYFGKRLQRFKKISSCSYPIQHGLIKNWDHIKAIWKDIICNELKSQPEERGIMTTYIPSTPKQDMEKTTEIMFEKFNVPAFYMAVRSTLALYASGRTTGLVLQCGHDITETVPIYEGYALPHATLCMNVGGKHINQRLLEGLKTRYDARILTDEILKDIKEKHCYVAGDVENEKKECDTDCEYKLPDGNVIKIGNERFECSEILWESRSVNESRFDNGIKTMVNDSIYMVDIDVRRDMLHNIVLCGGTTMMKGFGSRVEIDSRHLVYSWDGKVVAAEDRQHFSWIGGSILSSLSTFPQMWITKDEYDTSGPGIVHRKCF